MTKNELLKSLKNCSMQEKQKYACVCVKQYCEENHIEHPSITQLLNHLKSIPNAGHSVIDWNNKGAVLALNGRGDPVPASLEVVLQSYDRKEFMTLIESAVEVGIVDLFGAPSDFPIKFLEKIINILEKNKIRLPDINAINERMRN